MNKNSCKFKHVKFNTHKENSNHRKSDKRGITTTYTESVSAGTQGPCIMISSPTETF